MINYFVAYHYINKFGSGFGRMSIQRELLRPITSLSDIENIENTLIEKNKFDEVTIINWQKFEE
jgi:hypothetical protein